jgi:hypothetical protein
MEFVVYTWFPYQSSESCSVAKDTTILDKWFISVQGHFTKNTGLFPGKISNIDKLCPIKTFVRDFYWVTLFNTQNVIENRLANL